MRDVGIRDLDIRAPGFRHGRGRPTRRTGWSASKAPSSRRPRRRAASIRASNFTGQLIRPSSTRRPRMCRCRCVGGDDPIIAPPLYGHWHALIDRLDPTLAPTSWFHRLNADPRYRAAAGLGARVVRKNQEALHARRLAADRRCARGQSQTINRSARFGMLASEALLRQVAVASAAGAGRSPSPPRSSPTCSAAATTLRYQLGESRLSNATLSGACRKLTRPRGLVARRSFRDRRGAARHASVSAR